MSSLVSRATRAKQPEQGNQSKPIKTVLGVSFRYINRKNRPLCDAFFRNARHVELDTGHWVQAEDPKSFIKELVNFIETSPS